MFGFFCLLIWVLGLLSLVRCLFGGRCYTWHHSWCCSLLDCSTEGALFFLPLSFSYARTTLEFIMKMSVWHLSHCWCSLLTFFFSTLLMKGWSIFNWCLSILLFFVLFLILFISLIILLVLNEGCTWSLTQSVFSKNVLIVTAGKC